MKTIALIFCLALAGCSTLDAAGDRWLASDVSIVEAALLVDAIRSSNPDLGDFNTRLAAYASIDCLRLEEEEKRACVVSAISSLSGNE